MTIKFVLEVEFDTLDHFLNAKNDIENVATDYGTITKAVVKLPSAVAEIPVMTDYWAHSHIAAYDDEHD